ncbi:hypothetical protein BGW36DRAFT_194475 [Talaromyces proteolyticus]|uniref:Uncharacterized protein n=1 Tax=Talaromyces proteolyticus TaxID=1131652 RepID=A0AAD4KQQ4_9EURO|nr:uncharacterized protein BGW36DRAFT_194475 [Talaromyces proteolyticus]KAH8694971.1 hypothetical protein BGW36DRAFT_194475 [Talaromyces proteolyticus]
MSNYGINIVRLVRLFFLFYFAMFTMYIYSCSAYLRLVRLIIGDTSISPVFLFPCHLSALSHFITILIFLVCDWKVECEKNILVSAWGVIGIENIGILEYNIGSFTLFTSRYCSKLLWVYSARFTDGSLWVMFGEVFPLSPLGVLQSRTN